METNDDYLKAGYEAMICDINALSRLGLDINLRHCEQITTVSARQRVICLLLVFVVTNLTVF